MSRSFYVKFLRSISVYPTRQNVHMRLTDPVISYDFLNALENWAA